MPSTTTVNPTTEEDLETYPHMSTGELGEAIAASQEAFERWRRRPIEERAEIVGRLAGVLGDHEQPLSELMSQEMGKPIRQGPAEVQLCASICEYTAEHGPQQLADRDESKKGGRALVTFQPTGIIYGIQPWNFPMYQVIRYATPQLVAGNTVLLKHAANVWGMAKRLAELMREAGVPQGVFTPLFIDHDQSDAVIEDRRVRGVTFTGSASAGSIVASKAAGALKKTVLELGSNDAYLVLADADVELAAKACAQGRIFNNGETCVAAKRFIVAKAVYAEFRERFVERMKAVQMGDPMQKDTKLGPMARKDLRDDLHDQVRASVDKGAKVLVGGERPERRGWFYPATVLDDVTAGQPAYDDELFGPVASLIQVDDDDEAVRVANDSRFGLGGGIFSKDVDRAVEIARTRLDTGMVNVNGYNLAQPHLPFGGVKDSGYGREHGGFGIHEFVNAKAVVIDERS